MKIGIDGNCWYCSNGLSLGDSRAEFTFERILRNAVDKFQERSKGNLDVPDEMKKFLDMTPEEYKNTIKDS